MPSRSEYPKTPDVVEAMIRWLEEGGYDHAAACLRVDDWSTMTELERALIDSAMLGIGYVVDGKRVDPWRVVVYRQERPFVIPDRQEAT
jgi:hypothetical protein